MSKELSYEQAMAPLAEAIQLYAEAARLIAVCHAALENAKLQIEEIDLQLAKTVPAKEEA